MGAGCRGRGAAREAAVRRALSGRRAPRRPGDGVDRAVAAPATKPPSSEAALNANAGVAGAAAVVGAAAKRNGGGVVSGAIETLPSCWSDGVGAGAAAAACRGDQSIWKPVDGGVGMPMRCPCCAALRPVSSGAAVGISVSGTCTGGGTACGVLKPAGCLGAGASPAARKLSSTRLALLPLAGSLALTLQLCPKDPYPCCHGGSLFA